MKATAPEITVITHCSFCLKASNEVKKLVAGPGVNICDDCVQLCNQLIDEKAPAARVPLNPRLDAAMSDADMLGSLPRIATAGAQVERTLQAWVRKARERGLTWARIGAALGMTRQSAWERFSGEE